VLVRSARVLCIHERSSALAATVASFTVSALARLRLLSVPMVHGHVTRRWVPPYCVAGRLGCPHTVLLDTRGTFFTDGGVEIRDVEQALFPWDLG
jgi:hypothetical protein